MRELALLFCIFFTGKVFSQITYTSYFTQSFPTTFTTEIQNIDRRITFESQTISITTEIKGGKEIEMLNVEGHDIQEGTLIFFCKNRSKQNVTIAIPRQEKVEVIDYYYRSPKKKEEVQLRFHVERQ